MRARHLLPRVDLGRGWRGIQGIIADPDDSSHVFNVLEALSGASLSRMYGRFVQTPVGARLATTGLRESPLYQALTDRAALAALPSGSLGRAYLDFVDGEGLSVHGLMDASEASKARARIEDADQERFAVRLVQMHDLWHVVTGYHGDLAGESALMAFTFAQTWTAGTGAIALLAYVYARGEFTPVRTLIRDAFQRGRRAQWLPAADWEALLASPLSDVRQTLGLADPPPYKRVYRKNTA